MEELYAIPVSEFFASRQILSHPTSSHLRRPKGWAGAKPLRQNSASVSSIEYVWICDMFSNLANKLAKAKWTQRCLHDCATSMRPLEHPSTPHELMLQCCTLFQTKIPTKQHLAMQRISRQLGWKVWKVLKFCMWHGNSQLIQKKDRTTFLAKLVSLFKCCFSTLVSLRHDASIMSQIPK